MSTDCGVLKVAVPEYSAEKIVEKDCKADRECGSRSGARDEKLSPAVDETERTAVSVANDPILTGSARHHREQLRVRKCTGKREQSGEHPNHERLYRTADVARDDTRLQKDAGADDIGNVD